MSLTEPDYKSGAINLYATKAFVVGTGIEPRGTRDFYLSALPTELPQPKMRLDTLTVRGHGTNLDNRFPINYYSEYPP